MQKGTFCKLIQGTMILIISLFIMASVPEAAEKIVLNLAHIWGTTHLINIECEHFAKLVAEQSKDRIEIKIFPAQQLAKATELAEAVTRGTIDMGTIVGVYISGKMPLIDVYFLPGLYRWQSAGAALKAMTPLTGKILERELNVKPLFFFFGGSNELWTVKKPVRKIEDMQGMLIRGAGGVLTEVVKVYGATPVTVSGAEVYTALQRGTIDGTFWGSTSYHSMKAWEVCKYGTRLTDPFGLMFPNVSINLDKWKGLSKETQELLLKCAAETQQFCMEVGQKQVESLWEDAKKGGLEIIQMTPTEEKRWSERATKVWDWYLKRAGDEGKSLLETAEKYR